MPPALLMMRLRWLWSMFWGKIREGKKLSTEDLFINLGTIVGDLREIKADIARLDNKIDKTNQRIDDIVKTLSARIDDVVKSLSARIDETNRRIDETNKRIDDLARRIDAVQTTLLEIQKLLIELVKSRQ